MDGEWIIRLSLAAGLPLSDREFDAVEISRALPAYDIARFLDKLSGQERTIDAEVPLEAIALNLKREDAAGTLKREDAVRVFHSLFRLTHGGAYTGLKNNSMTRTRFQPRTALAVLKTASRIAPIIVPDASGGLSRDQFVRRRTTIKLFVDLAYLTVATCETPEVSAATLELMIGLSRRVGWVDFDRAIERSATHWSYLYLLPAKLAPGLLSRNCIPEIETLAARATLFEGSRETFEKALWDTLTQTSTTIPMASREWVEGFLGLKRPPNPPDLQSKSIDTASDVNLERMATLLLAAWEAREEGAKAQHLFQLFSGICKTAFRLSLAGDPGDTVQFDPAVHEASASTILGGGRVRLLRPWVQWGEPPVTRVIVRALVSSVEPEGSLGA